MTEKEEIYNWNEEIKKLEGWHFGGKGSGIEDELADLVVRGIKSATCSWLEAYKVENEPIPCVGERSYILNSHDNTVCVIELVSVEVKKFLEVDEEFAFLEGEGDRSYRYWKETHEKFFSEYGKEIGVTWDSEKHSVVCEKFKVLYVF